MKKRYLITYDLNNPGQNYEKVISAIKKASDGVWCTYWKSSYLIRSDHQTADEVSSLITPHLDKNDTLLVIEAVKNYQGWLNKDQWKFIRENVFGG